MQVPIPGMAVTNRTKPVGLPQGFDFAYQGRQGRHGNHGIFFFVHRIGPDRMPNLPPKGPQGLLAVGLVCQADLPRPVCFQHRTKNLGLFHQQIHAVPVQFEKQFSLNVGGVRHLQA